MCFLSGLSNDQLFAIIECKKREHLDKEFEQYLAQAAAAYLKCFYKKIFLEALLVPVMDTISHPLLMLWSVLGMIAFGFMALSVITGGVALITLVCALIFFNANYKEIERLEAKKAKFFGFHGLQLLAADELLSRYELLRIEKLKTEKLKKGSPDDASVVRELQNSTESENLVYPKKEFVDKQKWPRLRESANTTIITTNF